MLECFVHLTKYTGQGMRTKETIYNYLKLAYNNIDCNTYVSSKLVDGLVLDSLVVNYMDCYVDTGFGTDSQYMLVRTDIHSAQSIRPLKSPNDIACL